MHGRRRWIAAGIGLAAGLALAPATANAAGLIAAYDYYVPGKGFEIGLKDAQTGANLSLPAGVNTNDDELHPALSRDGRYILFDRMRLLPGLNGDFVPPEDRTIQRVDRQTGAVTRFIGGPKVAGPAFVRGKLTTNGSTTNTVSYGNQIAYFDGERSYVSAHLPIDGANNPIGPHFSNVSPVDTMNSTPLIETTHAVVDGGPNETFGRDRLLLTLAYINRTTGALIKSVAHLGFNLRQPNAPLQALRREFGTAEAPASHPVTRAGDLTVAFAMAGGGNFDIQTTTLPNGGLFSVPDPTAAPAAVNTADAEQMPAWSTDDLKLGFVRTAKTRRRLGVFDATPGIQSVVNSPVDIGPEGPTPQIRSFQSVWGGLSLSDAYSVDPPPPTAACNVACLAALRPPPGATPLKPVALKPIVKTGSGPINIGIFVARVTGTRRLLGRKVPRLRVIGKVPLGRARKGTNRFRWDRRVAGKRLKRGTYVLTFRTLKGKRVTSTSNSVRFTVAKSGRITRVKRQR